MKFFASLIMAVMSFAAFGQPARSFYSFKTTTIDGKPFDMASLKGKKVLVVNTASKCGNTPQYAKLQALYDQYKSENFVVIGFPANNFGAQEPGTNKEIQDFCTEKYQVTFPMMEKISVKGTDIDPIYKWLTLKSENGVMDAEVTWNFQKFMIDEKGKLIGMVAPKESPMSDKIVNWIKGN
jgi:glutathione peroxidase